MTIKPDGWVLKLAKYTDFPNAKSIYSGHWMSIMNDQSSNGYILRLSNLGVYVIENADHKLGIGLDSWGGVKCLKGSADWKFMMGFKTVSTLAFMDRTFLLELSKDLSCLKLTSDEGMQYLALTADGLYRYMSDGLEGLPTDGDGRIKILREGIHVPIS